MRFRAEDKGIGENAEAFNPKGGEKMLHLPAVAKGLAVLLVAGSLGINGLANIAKIGFFNQNSWVQGKYGQYSFHANVYPKPTRQGINSGRVFKLQIIDHDKKLIVEYNKGWSDKPQTKQEEKMVKDIVKEIESKVEWCQQETKRKKPSMEGFKKWVNK